VGCLADSQVKLALMLFGSPRAGGPDFVAAFQASGVVADHFIMFTYHNADSTEGQLIAFGDQAREVDVDGDGATDLVTGVAESQVANTCPPCYDTPDELTEMKKGMGNSEQTLNPDIPEQYVEEIQHPLKRFVEASNF
jgi:hypothetical protein